jgi:hypothetical protein
MSDEILVYELDGTLLEVGDIQLALNEAFAQLKKGTGAAYDRALAVDIDLSALPDSLSDVVALNKAGAGFDPSLCELVVYLAGTEMAKTVAKDLWEKVLLPYLAAKFGTDAVKQKKAARPRAEED